MGVASRYLRLPRPRTFLYIMSLRTGTEMITLSMLFNKVTGFYGLLAILTGFSLSPLQLSMYIYSLIGLIVLAFLMPHIRKQSPFQCLALAWVYIIDTVVNTAFTAAFAVTWLIAVSEDTTHTETPDSIAAGSADAAAAIARRYATDGADAISNAIAPGEDMAAAIAKTATGSAAASLGEAVGVEETIPSILLVVLISLVRLYFIFIVMAFARQVLRQHMYSTSTANKMQFRTDGTVDVPASNPFAVGRAEGKGWKGKLGRIMVSIGENYWLGGMADDDWATRLDGRFRTSRRVPSGPPGTVERERRARSGTGPPLPSPNVRKA